MRNPEVPQCQIDKNSFPNSTFRSEDEFIKGLQFSYPKPLDFFNLKLFLLNQTPGSERVNFIAKIVQNHPSEIKEVFKDLVANGLKIKPYISRKSEVLRDSVIKLIDDFINEDSNFPVHENSHESKNIFIAINARKINLVKAILERDPDSINAKNSQNKSPIHIVVSHNNKNLLQELLKYRSLDLYAKCNATNHDKSASSQLNVFDIAKTKNNLEIIQILENEHQMRLMAKNPDAIEFEKHRVPKEIASSSINPETSQQSSQLSQETVMVWEEARHKNYCFYQLSNHEEIEKMIIAQTTGGGSLIGNGEGSSSDLAPFNPPINEAVDSDSIGSEIATASDKSTNAGLQMVSSSINPETSQASPELGNEPVMPWEMMVWEDNNDISQSSDQQEIALQDQQEIDKIIAASLDKILNDIQTQTTGGGTMIGAVEESSSDLNLVPSNPLPLTFLAVLGGDSAQIKESIDAQTSSSAICAEEDMSASKKLVNGNKRAIEDEKGSTQPVTKSAKTTSEAGQSMDDGKRITSRIFPTSQEPLSGSDQGKGGSK